MSKLRPKSHDLKIAIVGNGAIGNLLALQCSKINQPYCLLTRDGQSLQVKATDTDQHSVILTPEVSNIESRTDADIIIFPLKAYQVLPALVQIKPYLRPSQILIFLHNGMGTLESAGLQVPDASTIMATTSYAGLKTNHNLFRATGTGTTQAGWAQHPKPQAEQSIRSLLDSLLPPLSWQQDILHAVWHKVAINAVINPLTALHQINNGQLLNQNYAKDIEKICQETAQVMTACGYRVESNTLVRNCLTVAENTSRNFSSMNRDVALGKPTEIDFINGYIVSRAEKFGLDVPIHKDLVERIKAQTHAG